MSLNETDTLEHAPGNAASNATGMPQASCAGMCGQEADNAASQPAENTEDAAAAVDISTGQGVRFQRIRRITGYLVGTLDRFNNAKRAEERDRVKHDAGGAIE